MRTVFCASWSALLLVGCGGAFTSALTDDSGAEGGDSPDASCCDAPTPDTGPDTGSPGKDSGKDTSPDAGTDTGMDAGTDGSCVSCPDAGGDAMADTGTDTGTDAGGDAGHEGGVDSGVDSGMDSGVDSGLDGGPKDSGLDAEAGITCTPGDLYCTGNTQVQCNGTGNGYINAVPCMYTCSEHNASLDAGTLCGVCEPNSYQCNGVISAETCDDYGQWQIPAGATMCNASCTNASRFTVSYDNDTVYDSFSTYTWAHRELNGTASDYASAAAYCTGLGPYTLPTRTQLLTLKITSCNVDLDNAAFWVDSLVEPIWSSDSAGIGFEWVYMFGVSGPPGQAAYSTTTDYAYILCIHT